MKFKMVLAIATTFACVPAMAATDVPLWHSLEGHNADVLKSMVKSFNRSQSDVNVKLRGFDSGSELNIALDKAAGNNELPALAHINGTHNLDDVIKRDYIQPFYNLQKTPELKKIKWFVSGDNAFIHDSQGRLLAFPLMLEIPVMYYNLESFQKANLVPAAPDRVWIDLQAQLVQMANNGSRYCPLTSDLPVSINLENLAAVNNQLFASAENGLKAKGLPSFSFDSTYVRHLALMISWVRSELMTKPDAGLHSISRFASGECAVLLSNSGHLGEFSKQNGLNFAVSGLPYYPEVTKSPGNPFISGAGLWALKSDPATTKAVVSFLSWLAEPQQAISWYQQTGYLPLTQEAFQQTPASYYQNLGQWHDLVAVYAQKSATTGKGFKINNYQAIHNRFNEILDSALSGNQPAVTALNDAAAEANRLVLQK